MQTLLLRSEAANGFDPNWIKVIFNHIWIRYTQKHRVCTEGTCSCNTTTLNSNLKPKISTAAATKWHPNYFARQLKGVLFVISWLATATRGYLFFCCRRHLLFDGCVDICEVALTHHAECPHLLPQGHHIILKVKNLFWHHASTDPNLLKWCRTEAMMTA